MERFLKDYFYSPTCGNISFDSVVEEIIKYISEKPEKFYDVIVGCDSSSFENPTFPTAIVVLRTGEGGRFFLKNYSLEGRTFSFSKEDKKTSWKRRVLEEVFLSCELALALREKLEKEIAKRFPSANYQFRYIHADLGEKGETRDLIKEVVGLIKGNGFEPKIKPEAYVASVVADRYT